MSLPCCWHCHVVIKLYTLDVLLPIQVSGTPYVLESLVIIDTDLIINIYDYLQSCVHCTVYTVLCTLYCVHCTVYTVLV